METLIRAIGALAAVMAILGLPVIVKQITTPKLEPSGFTNCSFVSFSAADIERWFAQELNS